MRTTVFRTSLIMVLIPLSFILILGASDVTQPDRTILYISGALLFAVSIWLWNRTWAQIKSEESEQKQNEGKILSELSTMNKNISRLIEEIRKDRRN